MLKTDYTYTLEDDVILVDDLTSGGAAITKSITNISKEIIADANISYQDFSQKHFVYRNYTGKYNGVRFNLDKSIQYFTLNATSKQKAVEYIKRVKLIHP